MRNPRPGLVLAALLAVWGGAAGRAQAAVSNAPRPSILIFQSYARDAGPLAATANILLERLRPGKPLHIVQIDMDLTRQDPALLTPATCAAALRKKTSGMDVVLVITVGDPAARMMARIRGEVFPGVPALMVACLEPSTPAAVQASNTLVQAHALTCRPAISNILRVLPETTNIVMVMGTTRPEVLMQKHFGHELSVFTNRVRFPLLQQLTMEEVETYCATLQPRSVIFFASFARDGSGAVYDYDFALRRVLAAANAPVFTLFESDFGDRVVGGPMLPDRAMGEWAAVAAGRLLRGERMEDLARPAPGLSPPVYDGRELQRWAIPEGRLPPGSRVLFRPPPVWVRYRTQLIILAAGFLAQGLFIVALLLNRRRLHRTQEALRASEARVTSAVAVAGLGFYESGAGGRVTFLDDRMRSMLGLSSPAVDQVREFWLDHVHPDDRPHLLAISRDFLARGGERVTAEYRYQHPARGLRWFLHLSCALARDDGGGVQRVTGVVWDITERKRVEAETLHLRHELAHVARVSMLGELASSLAHELNQPLAAILTNAQVARYLLAGPKVNTAELGCILDDIVLDDKRAGEVIHRLRSLVEKRSVQAQPVDLNRMASEVARLLHSELVGRGVRVELTLADALPPVLADGVEIQQVLINLLMNGMDALREQPAEHRLITVSTCALEGAVRATVRDSGAGIPPDLLPEIFRPFFTTKPTGLGMGLAISRSMIEAFGGRLWAENHPAGGAVLCFELPQAGGADTPAS